jgi:hypothetical protein
MHIVILQCGIQKEWDVSLDRSSFLSMVLWKWQKHPMAISLSSIFYSLTE